MESGYPLVITIVGAESSGKTMLAKQLAEALSCRWIPEYAREYLEKLDRSYEFEDLEEIAKGQWDLLLAPNPLSPSPIGFGDQRKGAILDSTKEFLKNISDLIISLNLLEKEILIIDSGMLTIRMWARIKYGRTIPFVEEKMGQDPTSLYLLCRPRMEWESDPLREAPSLVDRVWIYNQYLNELVEKKLSFTIVTTLKLFR